MKKVSFLLFIFILVFENGSMHAQGNNFIKLKGKQFYDQNGDPFFPIVCNYKTRLFFRPPSTIEIVSPEHHYGASGDMECVDQAACTAQMTDDFLEIKAIGFNSARVGFGGIYYDSINAFTFEISPRGWSVPYNYIVIQPPYDYASNQVSYDKIFSLYDAIYHAAIVADINLIWLINGNGVESDAANLASAAVDQVIVSHCKNYSKTIAYDLSNEPSPKPNWNATKEWCCSAIENMCSAIRDDVNGDPNHLITIGAYGPDGVWFFDVNVLNVDFISVHEYMPPELPNSITYLQADKTNMVNSYFYWLSQVCNKPFIVGETGFRADPATPVQYTDGTINEQYDYANSTFEHCVKCGFSGYSWWQFQDEFDMTGYDEHGNVVQNRFPYGVLYAGMPYNRKPICNYFQYISQAGISSITGSCSEPTNYTSDKGIFLVPTGSNTIHGTVKVNDVAQKNSVVFSRNLRQVGFGINAVQVDAFNIAFTDEQGSFIISPIPSDDASHPEDQIYDLKVTTTGSNRIEKGNWGNGAITDNDTYPLTDLRFNFNDIFENPTSSTLNKSFKAWNNLLITNFNSNQLSNIDFTARNEITVYNEHESDFLDEVHFFISDVFPDCNDIPEIRRNNIINNEITYSRYANQDFININFIKSIQQFTVFPNPFHGEFYIINNLKADNKYSATIIDQYGRTLITNYFNEPEVRINLSYYKPGLYYLKILCNNSSQVFYLINN